MDMMHRPEETRPVRNPVIGIPGQIIKKKDANPSHRTTAKLEESKVFKDKNHQTKGKIFPMRCPNPRTLQ